MSGSASISLEQAILGHTLGFAQLAFPSSVWVALCSASMPPSETVRGIEAFGGGYSRMRATFALIDTPANIAANTTSIEWPIASASWGTLGFFELWDAPTGGNRLYWGPFSPATPVTVAPGDIVRFSAGNLAVQASSGTGGTTSIGAYLPLAGGSMGGPLLLSHDPTTYLEAATKQYVDAHSGSGGGPGFLPLSGGTMLGTLSLAGNATLPMHAVPLQQVDTLNVVNVLNHGAKGDGTTDDTAAIQGVLNTYAGKATIFIPETGQPYIITTSPGMYGLHLPSNTDLLLDGTLLLPAGAFIAGNGVVNVIGVSRVIIRGHGTIDGNDPTFTGHATSAGLSMDQATNINVSGITIKNAHYWNLNVTRSTRVIVDGVSMIAGGNSPEFANACSDCWIVNSYNNGPTQDAGFAFYGGVTNSGAIGNVFTGASIYGLLVLTDTAQPAACSGIILSDNVVFGNGYTGIGILVYDEPVIHSKITISGNIVYGNGTTGLQTPSDILLDNCIDVVVSGNKCAGCVAGASGSNGITVITAVARVIITGNAISNSGRGTTTGLGINLGTTGMADILISGNHIYDDQGSPSMLNAIGGTFGPRNAAIGNFFGPTIGTAVAATQLGDTVIANSVVGRWVQNNQSFSPLPTNAGNDAAAQLAGVPVGGVYRNGSALMVRAI